MPHVTHVTASSPNSACDELNDASDDRQLLRSTTSTSSQLITMGGGANYPKHVWSPAGGWYAQPKNWKANTAVFGAVLFGLTALMFKLSADREVRYKMPEEGRFFPSRYWSKQIIEHEKAKKAEKAAES